jgi:two-component system sensor histidine kinase UhpB
MEPVTIGGAATRRAERSSRPSLVWRVFLVNAAVLLAASAVLLVTPVTVSSPAAAREVVAITAGLCLMLLLNLVLIRQAFVPLQRLAGDMQRFDPLQPGRRPVTEDAHEEVATLAHAYNEMLQRLEDERRGGAERAVRMQESERRRVARELHDQVGQSLTAMLLQIETAMKMAPAAERTALEEVRHAAREALRDVRRIAMQLRPQVLDELGLTSALLDLARSASRAGGLRVVHRFAEELPPLGPDGDLLVFRVAQESITNILRHAEATTAEITLERAGPAVRLTVVDDGRGIDAVDSVLAGGIRGMRERALLADADLTVERNPPGGTRVVLEVPVSS